MKFELHYMKSSSNNLQKVKIKLLSSLLRVINSHCVSTTSPIDKLNLTETNVVLLTSWEIMGIIDSGSWFMEHHLISWAIFLFILM